MFKAGTSKYWRSANNKMQESRYLPDKKYWWVKGRLKLHAYGKRSLVNIFMKKKEKRNYNNNVSWGLK